MILPLLVYFPVAHVSHLVAFPLILQYCMTGKYGLHLVLLSIVCDKGYHILSIVCDTGYCILRYIIVRVVGCTIADYTSLC